MLKHRFTNKIRRPVLVFPSVDKTVFLSSLDSFKIDSKGRRPSKKSKILTIGLFALFLTLVERVLRQVIFLFSNFHPVLQTEYNRNIIARHLGVVGLGCGILVSCAYQARHIYQDLINAVIWQKKDAMKKSYENRLFRHYAEGSRILTFFIGYIMKDTVDVFLWKDGMVFLTHHMLAALAAWGGLFPDGAHYYGILYFGLLETSTIPLSLLANFDDDFGAKGLGEALPRTKVAIGCIFAISFFVFRVVLWSAVSYFACKDLWAVLKSDDPRLEGRKTWFRYLLVGIIPLSLLQLVWLGDIIVAGKTELDNIGYL